MRFARSLTAARYTRRLLLLGCFAMALHLWAGMQLMSMQPARIDSQGNFVAEICTALSVSSAQAGPAQTTGNPDAPASNSNAHECCTLCVASSVLLVANTLIAASPAPTFYASLAAFSSVYPASFASTAHPPRGPPAFA